jgi:flagellar hook assembly protein FlgD
MHFPLLSTTEGISLERIDYNRPASDNTNWHSAAESVGFATPAYKNSQFMQGEEDDGAVTLSPEIFSPDNDGYNDVLNINCKSEGPGKLLNITIYDAKGRLIKYLIKSRYISGTETFSWDGTKDNNQKANIGIYLIYAELFDETGKVKHYRRTAVLGAKL